MVRDRDAIEIKNIMIENLNEGMTNKIITRKLYAKSDAAERNLRIAEKNHPEYKLRNPNLDKTGSEMDVKLSVEQKAFALKSRDLTEARNMIKTFQKSKDTREKLDSLQEIYALL